MNDLLIAVLILINIGVIYWILVGQRKYNKQIKND